MQTHGLRNNITDDYFEEQTHPPDDMGLFTFYRQQQESQEMRSKVSKTKVSNKKLRKSYRPKAERTLPHFNIQRHNQSFGSDRRGKQCQQFLKNIGIRSWKYKQINTCKNTQSQVLREDIVDDTRQLSKQVDKVKEQKSQQLSRSVSKQHSMLTIKTIEQIIKVSQNDGQSRGFQGNNVKKLALRLKSQQSETTKVFNYIKQQPQTGMNSTKYYGKSLQKSFLEKVRKSQASKDDNRNKLKISTGTTDNFHSENQKYLTNLIDKCYLPHRQYTQNQAAKILKQSLKFPNLLYTKTRIRTEGNQPQLSSSHSPSQGQTNVAEIRSFGVTRREGISLPKRFEGKEMQLFTEFQLTKLREEESKKSSPVKSIKNRTLRSIFRH